MQRKSDIALITLEEAALLGIAGELLLRVGPWGINAFLAAVALGAGFHALIRRLDVPLHGTAAWLSAVVPLLAAILAWRASPALFLLAVLGVLLALVGASLAAHGRTLRNAGTWDVAAEAAATGLHIGLGVLLLLRDVSPAEIRWTPWHTKLGAVVRGVVLAIPPLVVFGALFMAADAAFARVITDLFRIDLDEVMSHIVLAGFFTCTGAGYLYWVVANDGSRVPRSDALGVRLGALETGVVLGMVTVLFVAFIAVQFTYLFGGEALVQATTGLTYAEYARSGFFELVTVAFLVLPLLLVTLWLVRGEAPRSRRLMRMMAAGIEVLIFVIMGSALYRMQLYQEAYGLTHLRFYTTAFIAWLAVVFLIFAATVLRGAPRYFTTGAVATALAGVMLLVAVNPDARIVDTNVERARDGADFDAAYVRELSADAVPALVAGLPSLEEADRCATAHWLVERWGADAERGHGDDWRTWNYARVTARRVVRENEAMLRAVACAPASG
ncbi:MAG: DUF4153 domain-containing protein [Gemmatimonadales bacterium]